MAGATAILAHCQLAADAVRREFDPAAPIFVVPHGNFIGVLEPPVSREEARAEAGIGEGDFVYGFIGNLLPYKGLEELIARSGRSTRPIVAAHQRRQPARLRRDPRTPAAGHPRIIMRTFDYAPGEAFVRVLQASDVIVLPFRASTTSGSLVQALSWPSTRIVPAMGCLPDADGRGCGHPLPAGRGRRPGRGRCATIRGIDLAAAGRAAWRSADTGELGRHRAADD